MNEETNTQEISTEEAREIKKDISQIMGHGTKGEDVKMAMTFVPLGNFRRPQVRSMSCGCQRIYVQLIGFLIFVLLIAVIRMISNMRVVFVQYHMASDTDGELVLLPVEFAASRGAFCLDGSPPGYYIRYGKSPNINKWIIYLPGGAWCTSEEECYSRSFTDLGSSMDAPALSAFGGILSASETDNPDFHKWNMVKLIYCDGSSYLGNRSRTVEYKSKPIYLRGFPVFVALIDHLIKHTDLSSADNVILAGTSAGGIGALVNGDFLRDKLSSVESLHVLLDGAMFPDQPSYSGEHVMANLLKKTFYFHNIKDSVSIKDCTSELDISEQWKCLQPNYYYKHVYTPAFFIQSLHDTWFSAHALGVQCSTKGCKSTQIQIIDESRQKFLSILKNVMLSKGDGLFVSSCPFHWVLLKSTFYENLNINGTNVADAVGQWYFHRKMTPAQFVQSESRTEMKHKCNNIH